MSRQKTIKDRFIPLTQSEADLLIQTEKHYLGEETFLFPYGGRQITVPLFSAERKHEFTLDVNSKRLDIRKYTFGNRTKSTIILVRVDLLDGGKHVNPDETIIEGPHIHEYREGFGDRFARPLPPEFGNPHEPFNVFLYLMNYCKVVTKPRFHNLLPIH